MGWRNLALFAEEGRLPPKNYSTFPSHLSRLFSTFFKKNFFIPKLKKIKKSVDNYKLLCYNLITVKERKPKGLKVQRYEGRVMD